MKKRIHLELRNRTPSDVSWPHISVVMFHSQQMENLSCDVLAWGYKVSYKLKKMMETSGHIVALRTRLQSAGAAGTLVKLFVHVFDMQFENAAQLFLCQRYKQGKQYEKPYL